MKIQTVLYYRYLFRQSLIISMVYFGLIAIINVILFLTKFDSIQNNLIIFVVALLIWLIPIFLFVLSMIFLYNFLNNKNKLKNIELYKLITNKLIRQTIVKNANRIKIIFPPKNQIDIFSKSIETLIEKKKSYYNLKKDNINDK